MAWKLVPATSPPLYANPGSDHARRGKFATKTLWVTPQSDAEVYPAGIYPLEPNPVGIEQWTSQVRAVRLCVLAVMLACVWCLSPRANCASTVVSSSMHNH